MSHAEAFDLDRIGGRRALRDLLDEVVQCGEIAMQMYRRGLDVHRKRDESPVTEADRQIERRLRAYVSKRYPDAAFLGEESGETAAPGSLRFVIDPIDGTRAFVRGLSTWSVLVGLEADGEPVLGIAFMPAQGDVCVGVRGDGAQVNGRPARLTDVRDLGRATVSHGALHQFTGTGLGHVLLRLGERTEVQRGFGDFEGYRQLLTGRVDAMIDPDVSPWDVCAAAVLVREAGGRFSDFTGVDTIHAGSALATNGPLHEPLLALLAE
jgi:histidinol phosphatase-like enzyme (inositol monophosphatase family)